MEQVSLTLLLSATAARKQIRLKKKAIGQSGNRCQFNSTEIGEDDTKRVFKHILSLYVESRTLEIVSV